MNPTEGTGVISQEVQHPTPRGSRVFREQLDSQPCINENGEELKNIYMEEPGR